MTSGGPDYPFTDFPVESVASCRGWRVRQAVKRLIDFVCSATLLLLLSPIIVAVAIAVRLTMGRPVLFTQSRPGRNQVPFTMLKFRTMSEARDPSGELLADASRTTGLGQLLRAWSLDELPQLFNILRGDMSFIGPRPLLSRYLPYYTERELVRFNVQPGISGWAQIHGRNEVSWDARIAHDVWYVEHWSLRLDLRIALNTVLAVATRRGFSGDPEAIMQNFDDERRQTAWVRFRQDD